mgnify:CR=1 FL=1
MMDPIEPERIRGMSGEDDDAAGMLLSPLSLLTAALLLLRRMLNFLYMPQDSYVGVDQVSYPGGDFFG